LVFYDLGGDMTTNEQRAERAWKAATRYQQAVHGDSDGDITDETITDLLTDLMHLCDAHEFDFDACLRMANTHHDAEVNYEDDD
jgi:hypothetical protein